MRENHVTNLAASVFAGQGEMATRSRVFDWAATSLGSVEQWPQALRTIAQTMLPSIFPTIILWGPELLQIYNDGYRTLMGEKHPAGLGQPTRACWPEVWHINAPIYERVLEGETVAFEDALYPITRSGVLEDAWFSLAYAPIRDEDASVGGICVTVHETTAERLTRTLHGEREMLLKQISIERNRLFELFRQAPAFLAVVRGPEHRFEFANDAYSAMVGHRPLIGRTVQEALPEIAGQGFERLLDRVLATGVPFIGREMPIVLMPAKGMKQEERFLDFVYQAVTEADGSRSGVMAHGSDVTEQVQARREVERLLAESENARVATEHARQQAEAVLGSIADPFFLLDKEWRFTYVNDAAPPVIRTTREALLGRTVWEMFPELAGTTFEAAYLETMTTGRPTSAEAFYPALDAWFDVRAYRWSEGLMVHFRDVSARKTAEVERERLLADAETANRAKGDFLGVMSHELRTPLNAIGGYAELVELGVYGPITPELRGAMDRIQRSQRHLLGLINGVLNFVKVDAGAVLYDREDVALDEVLTMAEALTAPQMLAKQLEFRVLPCDPRIRACADREKVQQVVLNLLSNAIKFTEAGGRVSVECVADDHGQVAVRVADTGRGIEPHQLEHVFEPFVQVDLSLVRTKEGTGLGLAISRHLARGMRGDLTVESEPGVGSTFTLTLPGAQQA